MPNRVLGVLSGEDLPLELLRRWAESASVLIAADGGADRLRKIGIVPHVTIGDLDSISDEARRTQDQLIHLADQDTTDCDKLLAHAEKLGHARITLASVEGDLIDHVIGSLSSAVASNLDVRLALRRGVGWILKGSTRRVVRCGIGSRVSLLPLASATRATMSGVEWPIQDLDLALGGKTSLSNRSTEERVVVQQSEGASLLFVEYPASMMPFWPEETETRWQEG